MEIKLPPVSEVPVHYQVDAAVGGKRKPKKSAKSENVDPTAEPPRAMRSAGSYIPVCMKPEDEVHLQKGEVKKSVGGFKKERDSESWRRPLSVLDRNRGESLTSAADLSDSVFADARCKL